jgi:hypothetical protein
MVQTKPTKNEVPVMDERTKQKFEELKRRYFWQQKRREVGFGILIILLITLTISVIMPLIGLAVVHINPSIIDYMNEHLNNTNPPYEAYIFTGCYGGLLLIGFMALAFTFLAIAGIGLASVLIYGSVGVAIIEWINSNWKQADYRAKQDLGLIKKIDQKKTVLIGGQV